MSTRKKKVRMFDLKLPSQESVLTDDQIAEGIKQCGELSMDILDMVDGREFDMAMSAIGTALSPLIIHFPENPEAPAKWCAEQLIGSVTAEERTLCDAVPNGQRAPDRSRRPRRYRLRAMPRGHRPRLPLFQRRQRSARSPR